jgi:probable O-glycosylation ligase (exosortase A-associated)
MGLRDIAVLAIVIAMVPVSLLRPWIGVLTWSWLGYMNPHKLTWNLSHLPLSQAIAGATLLGLFFARDRRPIPWTREMIILVVLAIYFTITTAFAWYPEESWPIWEEVMKIFLFTFVTTMMIYGRFRIRTLCLVIVGSLGFYGVKGGIFTIATGGHNTVWGPPHSFFGDNNTVGLVLLMVMPLALLIAREEPKKWLRIGLYSVFWLSIPAVIGTYSRGALIGLFAVFFALFWRYKRQLITLSLVAPLALVFAKDFIPQEWYARQESTLEYKEDWSAMQRLQAWSVAFNIARDRPFLGAGFKFEYGDDVERWLSYASFIGEWKRKTKAAHSIYFQVMGDHGFVAFFLFMLLLSGTFFRLGKLSKIEYPPEMAWVGRYAKAIQISLIGYGVSGTFLSLAYFDLFYAYVAMSAMLQREANELPRAVTSPRAIPSRAGMVSRSRVYRLPRSKGS